MSKEILNDYKKRDVENITVDGYVRYIDRVIDPIRLSENFWQKVGSIKRLSAQELLLVKSICQDFRGSDMTVYVLTELMTSADGDLNIEILDFLTRNAGREYIEYIPAIHDNKASFGPLWSLCFYTSRQALVE